jgi:NAD(P)H-hydrate epimerase
VRTVTREEMREIERRAVEEFGIGVNELMESAGKAVADAVEERASKASPVVAVCGKGNNGGDGFVAARLLSERGFEVEVLATASSYDPATAAGRNRERARALESIAFVDRFKRRPMAVIVDALFGTGLSREVRGRERGIIDEINSLDERWFPVVAVDIPSGMDADTGRPLGAAVRAQVTVTFGLPKAGFRSPEAKPYLGELVVAPIGLPPELLRG